MWDTRTKRCLWFPVLQLFSSLNAPIWSGANPRWRPNDCWRACHPIRSLRDGKTSFLTRLELLKTCSGAWRRPASKFEESITCFIRCVSLILVFFFWCLKKKFLSKGSLSESSWPCSVWRVCSCFDQSSSSDCLLQG
jgi:hypothetical protein